MPLDQRLLQRPEIRKDLSRIRYLKLVVLRLMAGKKIHVVDRLSGLRKGTASHILQLQVHVEVVISPVTAVVGDDVRMPLVVWWPSHDSASVDRHLAPRST